MSVPNEWKKFLNRLWRGSLEEVADERAWVSGGLKWMTNEERREIADFIDFILAQEPSSDELFRIWNENSSEYYIGPGMLARPDILFAFIRDKAREMNAAK